MGRVSHEKRGGTGGQGKGGRFRGAGRSGGWRVASVAPRQRPRPIVLTEPLVFGAAPARPDDAVAAAAPAGAVVVVEGTPWWKAERLAVELTDWRSSIELWLAGAVCRVPLIGLRRADELSVAAPLFERRDAQLIYLAVRWCADRGELRGEASEDRTTVLATARRALRWGGFWDDAAIASERGFAWSDANLVSLALSTDGPADVVLYGTQLLDLDRRLRVARRCWARMTAVLDGWGKAEG